MDPSPALRSNLFQPWNKQKNQIESKYAAPVIGSNCYWLSALAGGLQFGQHFPPRLDLGNSNSNSNNNNNNKKETKKNQNTKGSAIRIKRRWEPRAVRSTCSDPIKSAECASILWEYPDRFTPVVYPRRSSSSSSSSPPPQRSAESDGTFNHFFEKKKERKEGRRGKSPGNNPMASTISPNV